MPCNIELLLNLSQASYSNHCYFNEGQLVPVDNHFLAEQENAALSSNTTGRAFCAAYLGALSKAAEKATPIVANAAGKLLLRLVQPAV